MRRQRDPVHRRSRLRPRPTALFIECLEDRTLMSVQFTPAPYTMPAGRPDTPLGMGGLPEPLVAVNPTDAGNIAVSSQNQIRVSTNGGATFTATTLFPGSTGGDTAMTFDSTGRLFWVNIAGPGLTIVQINPSTGAVSAGPFTVDNGGAADDKEFIAADPTNNNLYVVWTAFIGANTEVFIRRSTNQGVTWSAAVRADVENNFVWPASVTVSTTGFVYVAYHSVTMTAQFDVPSHDGRIVVVRYNNDLTAPVRTLAENVGFADITFNIQDNAATRKVPLMQFWQQGSGEPWILADPARPGNVYVISADTPNTSDDHSLIRISRSTNNGVSWATQGVIVDSGLTPNARMFPTAAIDKFGNIIVAYYDDRRLLLNPSGRLKLDVYAKYSTDGGITFSPAFPVDDQTWGVNTTDGNIFDPDPGAPIRFPGPAPTTRIGEYFGVAIFGGTAYAAWNGNTFSSFNNPTGQQTWFKSFGIRGALTVTGTPGSDLITLRTTPGNSAFYEAIVNGQRQYAGLVSALSGVTVAATTGDDTVNVENTVAGTPVSISQGSGTDTVNISPTAHLLSNIQASVNVNGGSGFDGLTINDSADGADALYTLGSSSVGNSFSSPITFSLQNSVVVTGGNQRNEYDVNGTTSFSPGTTLNTGSGVDKINVRATTGTLNIVSSGGNGDDLVVIGDSGSVQNVAGTVNVQNPGFATQVVVDDSLDATSQNATMTVAGATGTISGFAPANINLNDINFLTIWLGTGGNRFNVEQTPAFSTTIGAGGGGDIVRLSPTAQLLGNFGGPFTFAGTGAGIDTIEFFDGNNPAAETYNFNAVPDNLALLTVGAFFNFPNVGAVYLETNGISTVNDPSGTVFVDVPPPSPGSSQPPGQTVAAALAAKDPGLVMPLPRVADQEELRHSPMAPIVNRGDAIDSAFGGVPIASELPALALGMGHSQELPSQVELLGVDLLSTFGPSEAWSSL
jgi:hypothetical protein